MPISDEQVTTLARARYLQAKQFAAPWREEATEAYDYVAGHQIAKEDLARLKRDNRPAVVFNLIGPNLKAISGMERGNRHELTYLPRESSQIDGYAAEIYNQTARWIFDRNENEFYESKAFRDMCITGMGWTQTRVDFDEDPSGMVNSPSIDPLRKLWDPSAKMENLIDRRYDFTEVTMDRDEFEAQGDAFAAFARDNVLAQTVFGDMIEDPLEHETLVEHTPDQYAQPGNDTSPERYLGKVAVLEYNFFIWEEVFRLHDPTGAAMRETTDPEEAAAAAEALGPDAVEALGRQRRYYKAWFNGDALIELQPNTDPRAFTEYAITGEYDHNKGYYFGVVRAMIDPQLWSNKLFMQLLHIINSNAKGGFFFKKGAFANQEKALRDWARGDRGIEVNENEDLRHAIQERAPTPMPTAMHELLLFVTGIIPRVSGFNMELLGMAGKDQPGVLEHMRKQAGMTILAPFFDALRLYRKQKGRGLVHFMREYIGPERMARIVDDRVRPALQQILALPGVDAFDILIEESPQSPNQKTSNFIMLGEILQTMPNEASLIIDLVLEQSPLPTSLVRAISERLAAARQPDPIAQRRAIAEVVGEEMSALRDQMAALKDQTSAILNIAKAGTEEARPNIEREKIDADLQADVLEFAQTSMQTGAQLATSKERSKSND